MRRLAAVGVVMAVFAAYPAAACSYASWNAQERTVALRYFQREALARATQVFVAEVVDTRPSTEEMGSVVSYQALVPVIGSSSLPSPWSTVAICELPNTKAKIGDRVVMFAAPDANGELAVFNSFRIREIYVSSLRRQVSLALRSLNRR